eukprot:scaffold10212_cov101-Phaeocystis_antarctica.AAC.2
MTPNHLAWAKVTQIKNKSTIRALLERSKRNLTASIPKHIAVIDDSPLDVSATIERIGKETTAEIDAIATSINMMPLIDPTFAGYVIGEPLIAKSKRQILVSTDNYAGLG